MITRRFSTLLVATAVAMAISTLAQQPANGPKVATALCKDGTLSYTATQQGACSNHGGVKTWWGANAHHATAGSPATPPPKTATKSTAQPAAVNAPDEGTVTCKDGTHSEMRPHG